MANFQPVIKWSGSKRSQADEIIKYFPTNIDTYYEPFIGGASILRKLMECSDSIHVDKYDYSLIDYKNNKTKICIICPEHGEFWQLANSHLKGCGCPKCTAMDYAYWLGELGFHHGYIEEISVEIMKHKQ